MRVGAGSGIRSIATVFGKKYIYMQIMKSNADADATISDKPLSCPPFDVDLSSSVPVIIRSTVIVAPTTGETDGRLDKVGSDELGDVLG